MSMSFHTFVQYQPFLLLLLPLAGLAISLETLADYVGEVAPTAGSYWVSAASATAVRRRSSGKQLPTAGAPPQSAVVIPASGGGSAGAALAGKAAGSFVGRPASQEELASWRGVLAGHDHWSSAVPLLREYYSRHGFGITSRNSALRWSKGGFEEATEGGLAPNYVPGEWLSWQLLGCAARQTWSKLLNSCDKDLGCVCT
jgi:hypothetical protein